jgi:hypothetical protein
MYAPLWTEWVVNTGKADPNEPIDFWKPALYDKVIDTYSINQSDALQIVLDAIKKS